MGQDARCRDDLTADAGYKVRSVRVEARGGWTPQLSLPISPGDDYSPTRRAAAHRAVREALRREREQLDFELESLGAVSVLYVTSCVKVVPEGECPAAPAGGNSKCVDVVVEPFYIRLDTQSVGSNILPLPRSNRPTFYRQTPPALLALKPTFGAAYDREYGLSQTAGISPNLIELPRILKGAPVSQRNTELTFDVKGRKSLSETFYHAQTKLSLSHKRVGALVENVAAEGSFVADHQPLGEGKFYRNAFRAGVSLKLRPRRGLLNTLTAGASYRRSNNRFFGIDGRAELATEDAFEARALLEGRAAGGFARAGLWFDSGSPEKPFDSYRRLVGVVGYQKEIAVKTNQTVGVEATLGAGRSWGRVVPRYARFYGGNWLGNFLYDGADSPALRSLPRGPLIRSFGVGQAVVAGSPSGRGSSGGDSFWHVNANLTIPIPALSRPLIPAENVFEDEDGPGGTLKDILKGQVRTAESFIITELKQRQPELSEQEAQARARKIIDEIRPAVAFIADQANIYSIKPLLMIDAARIESRGFPDNKTRLAFGGGLQLTIVVAKFEAGYIRTVRRVEGDPRGNFVMRLVFQNLF
ncbi:MAG: hypothetical protein ACRD9R_07130 [Pyrinomonadaceae bacterium]